MILVGIFFVSGADAASIVMGTLSQKGALEPDRLVVVFWGVVTGAVAAIMLLIGNGKGDALAGLQNLTILVAAPFVLVMIGMCVALMRDLRQDPLIVRGEMGAEAVGVRRHRGPPASTTVTSRSVSAPASVLTTTGAPWSPDGHGES